MNKIQLMGFFLIIIWVSQLVGCMAAGIAYEAIAVGNMTKDFVAGFEGAKVDAAVSPGVTKEQLNGIKRLAFAFEDDAAVDKMISGGVSELMADTMAMEMMKMGFTCLDKKVISAALGKEGIQSEGKITLENSLKAGKVLGIQAIVTGNVTASSSLNTGGLMSSNFSATTKIQSASIKIIGVDNTNILMVATINYKKGKNPNDAAKSIAKIIKAKLENPFDEKKIREKENTH